MIKWTPDLWMNECYAVEEAIIYRDSDCFVAENEMYVVHEAK